MTTFTRARTTLVGTALALAASAAVQAQSSIGCVTGVAGVSHDGTTADITDSCPLVSVMSDDNTLTVSVADRMSIAGNGNRVTVRDHGGSITFMGDSNEVTLGGSGADSVTFLGNGNRLLVGAQAGDVAIEDMGDGNAVEYADGRSPRSAPAAPGEPSDAMDKPKPDGG